MIDKDTIQKINEGTNILELVQEAGVTLEKRGKNYFGLCPFHDDTTPSLSVSTEKHIALCMSCKKGGQPITFYKEIYNVSFEKAAQELAKRIGLKLNIKEDKYYKEKEILEKANKFYQTVLFNTEFGKKGLEYLQKRNISLDTIKHFNIGMSLKENDILYKTLKDSYDVSYLVNSGVVKHDKEKDIFYDFFVNRLLFPITNTENEVIGFSGRIIEKSSTMSKYSNSQNNNIFDKGKVIYHLKEALIDNPDKEVILYEGFFDVISSYQAGLKNGIATMGTSLTSDHVKLLEKHVNVLNLCYDGDSAGQEALKNNLKYFNLRKIKINIIILPEKLDPDEYINKYGNLKYLEFIKNNKKDYYNYHLDLYSKNLDINNSNDVSSFIKEINDVFKDANLNIKKMYEQKISNLLKFDFKFSLQNVPDERHEIKTQKKSKTRYCLYNYEDVKERIITSYAIYNKELREIIEEKVKVKYFINKNDQLTFVLLKEYFSENYPIGYNEKVFNSFYHEVDDEKIDKETFMILVFELNKLKNENNLILINDKKEIEKLCLKLKICSKYQRIKEIEKDDNYTSSQKTSEINKIYREIDILEKEIKS